MSLIIKEKRKNHISGSSQVYGRATPEKATYLGRLGNIPCTLRLIVASSFTGLPERAGKNRADYQRAAAKAFVRKIA